MSKSDKYFTVPLATLRAGESAADALEIAVQVGIVNAGVGYEKTHDSEDWEQILSDAQDNAETQGMPVRPPPKSKCSPDLWFKALVGWHLLGVTGGNTESHVGTWEQHHRQGDPFFRIRRDFLWNAVYTARRDAGGDAEPDKPLSWREFRILAAILSAPVNRYGFTFLGWESIQARASGFHNKKGFAQDRETLPDHCAPLTRSMIRDALNRLESLGFFGRFQYRPNGRVGGYTAYTFRLDHSALIAAVHSWAVSKENSKIKLAAKRAHEAALFQQLLKSSPTDSQHK